MRFELKVDLNLKKNHGIGVERKEINADFNSRIEFTSKNTEFEVIVDLNV